MSRPFYVSDEYADEYLAKANRFNARPAEFPDGTKGVVIYGPGRYRNKWNTIIGIMPEHLAVLFADSIVDSLENPDA